MRCIAILVTFLVCGLAGCASSPRFEGSWQSTAIGGRAAEQYQSVSLDLKADGTAVNHLITKGGKQEVELCHWMRVDDDHISIRPQHGGRKATGVLSNGELKVNAEGGDVVFERTPRTGA